MKTISAKEFRRRQSAIFKEVAAGQTYQVTHHRQPLVKLSPAVTVPAVHKQPRRGTYAALLESLQYSVKSTGDMQNLSHKDLRGQMIEEKHGRL